MKKRKSSREPTPETQQDELTAEELDQAAGGLLSGTMALADQDDEFLALQQTMQLTSRSFTSISNLLKTKQDAESSSIDNMK